MKKLASKSGLTLIEMLVTILILVFLVLGIGTCMDSALNIYDEAKFESNSASMANIVNTSLADILRYSDNLTDKGETVSGYFTDSSGTKVANVDFVFTNYEYAVRDAYFTVSDDGVLRIKNLGDSNAVELVNTGAYPDLKISSFKLTYTAKGTDTDGNPTGGYFEINYTIYSDKDSNLTKDITYIVRSMNPV